MKDLNFFKTKDSIYLKNIKKKSDLSLSDECDGYLITGSENEARKIITSLRDRKFKGKIGFLGGDSNLNRRAIETLRINYLVSPEIGNKKDTLKQGDSGLNHVVAKIAREKDIVVVIDLGDVVKLSGKERAFRIRKIIQNVKVCRRAKCEIKIASFSTDKNGLVDEKGRKSIGVSFGMNSVQSSNAVRF